MPKEIYADYKRVGRVVFDFGFVHRIYFVFCEIVFDGYFVIINPNNPLMIQRHPPENFKEKFEVVSCFIEHDSKILLLHRQDHKPQGNTWGVPAGKVDEGEDVLRAIIREIGEETGINAEPHQFIYFEKFFVRYPEYDFTYHIFHLPVNEKPSVNINPIEHKDTCWLTPKESLELDLIPDEDFCIQSFFGI